MIIEPHTRKKAMENSLPFDKVLHHEDIKEAGEDYVVVYEYTCISCNHKWRYTALAKNPQCPKCRSIKLCYVSKRSCDEFIDEEAPTIIPEDSPLL
jgi:predicted Zn-ribbon and HTH transcriptional regulator